MAKRNRRRSNRSSRPPTRQAYQAKPPPPRWWKRVTKTFTGLGIVTKIIIGAGTLAGAIATVLTLILSLSPKPAPENIGRFISVQALSQVPLSEYPQRSAVFKSRSAEHPLNRGPLLAMAVVRQSSPPSIQSDATATPSPTIPTPSPSPTIRPHPSPSPTIPTPVSLAHCLHTYRDDLTDLHGLINRYAFSNRDLLTPLHGLIIRGGLPERYKLTNQRSLINRRDQVAPSSRHVSP